MKKNHRNIKIIGAVLSVFLSINVRAILASSQESPLSKPNYLVPDENYFKDSEIRKGDLDTVIKENVSKLIESANSGKLVLQKV